MKNRLSSEVYRNLVEAFTILSESLKPTEAFSKVIQYSRASCIFKGLDQKVFTGLRSSSGHMGT